MIPRTRLTSIPSCKIYPNQIQSYIKFDENGNSISKCSKCGLKNKVYYLGRVYPDKLVWCLICQDCYNYLNGLD